MSSWQPPPPPPPPSRNGGRGGGPAPTPSFQSSYHPHSTNPASSTHTQPQYEYAPPPPPSTLTTQMGGQPHLYSTQQQHHQQQRAPMPAPPHHPPPPPGGSHHASQPPPPPPPPPMQQNSVSSYHNNGNHMMQGGGMPPPPPPPASHHHQHQTPTIMPQQQFNHYQHAPPHQQQQHGQHPFPGQAQQQGMPGAPPPPSMSSQPHQGVQSSPYGMGPPRPLPTQSQTSYGHPTPTLPIPGYQTNQNQSYPSQYSQQQQPPPPPPQMGSSMMPPPPSPSARYAPPPPLPGTPAMNNNINNTMPKTKIDPSQIPHPPLFTRPQQDEDGQHHPVPIYYPQATVTSGTQDTVQPPPAADSRFLVQDDGNASPQLLRSTVYSIPPDRAVWRKCGEVDLGLLCSPMALPSSDFVLRPRVLLQDDGYKIEDNNENNSSSKERKNSDYYMYEDDWKDPQAIPIERSAPLEQPPRCSRCQAYVNPFWNVDAELCNLCGARNRSTAMQLAGHAIPLQYGTVDFVVGGPYVTRSTPVQPVVVYAIDVTCPNVKRYLDILESVVYQLAYHYERQQETQNRNSGGSSNNNSNNTATGGSAAVRVGIVLVGVGGIFVPDPQGGFVVVPDVQEEPFCPFPLTEWTWNVASSRGRQGFDMFMKELRQEGQLKKIITKTRETNASTGPHREGGEGDGGLRRGHSLSCGGAALSFLANALAETGGRGVWISWRRPNYGVGAIRDRERKGKDPYGKNEANLFQPLQRHPTAQLQANAQDAAAAKFYRDLGAQCAKSCVALDVVLHTDPTVPQSFLDLATLGELTRITCGRTVWISRKSQWRPAMREALLRHLLCYTGWDAVFKVRCSVGLQVKKFSANTMGVIRDGIMSDSPELELAVVTPDTRIAVELEHRVGGLPKDSKYVYIQSALLYTCITSGERRVRVSTLALRTGAVAADTFRSMDFGAIATFQLRHTAECMLQTPSDASDERRATSQSALLERCQRMLASYRLHTKAFNSPLGQLILPEKLQLLPLFCTSLIKSPILRPSMPRRGSGLRSIAPSPRGDERAYYLWHAATLSSPAHAMLMVYPNIFPIGNLQNGDGQWQRPDPPQQQPSNNPYMSSLALERYVQMPATLHPTISSLAEDGIYLVDACFVIYLYIGRSVPEETVQQLEVAVVEDMDPCRLSSSSSSSSSPMDVQHPIVRLIWQLRTFSQVGGGSESMVRPTFAPIVIVRDTGSQDDDWSRDVNRWMVCDATSHEKDYVDFLCDIHRQIKSRVDSGKA